MLHREATALPPKATAIFRKSLEKLVHSLVTYSCSRERQGHRSQDAARLQRSLQNQPHSVKSINRPKGTAQMAAGPIQSQVNQLSR